MATEAHLDKARRPWGYALAPAGAIVLLWGGWLWWMGRRYRSAIAEIESEMAGGRFAVAVRDLVKILTWKPDSDEAAYLLGTCEQARGRANEAEEAWARIAPGATFWRRSILARLRLFHEGGRLDAAERLILAAAADPRNERTAVLVLLVPMYSEQGRIDEAARLVEAQWEHLNETGEGASEPGVKLIRLHMELTLKAIPVETLRALLAQRRALAADDDRVWLGEANVALRTGAFDVAEQLLDACLKRRPTDEPVWRAAELGHRDRPRRRRRNSAERTCPPHFRARPRSCGFVPGSPRKGATSTATQGPGAPARRGSGRSQRAARLAQLAEQDGQPVCAVSSRNRRGKSKGSKRATRHSTTGHNRSATPSSWPKLPSSSAATLRRSAAHLTVAISENPDRGDLRRDLERLSRRPRELSDPGQTLADLVARERSHAGKIELAPSR